MHAEVHKLTKQANYLRLHRRQVARQLVYMEELEEWLREDWWRVVFYQ